MTKPQKLALIYLWSILILVYGYMVGRYQLFPYDFIEATVAEIDAFAQGDPMEKESTVVQKVMNDVGISPERFIYPYPANAIKNAQFEKIPGLRSRRDPPYLYIDPEHRKGYRVIIGAFDFDISLWGGILINSDGRVVHTWRLSTDHLPTSRAKAHLKNLYGVHVFPDGSVIFNMQEDGGGIVKVDACSMEVWNLPGVFHHTVSPTEDGYFWTFMGSQLAFDQDMARISVATGKIDKVIRMKDVRSRNPYLRLWNLQRDFGLPMARILAEGNITHGNDIDPLPRKLSHRFPQFETGDLLISYAITNLIFVLDPETLKVKWWRVGLWDIQHDPDWEPDGTITVYDNSGREKNRPSNVIKIDPVTMDYRVVVDGEKYRFRSDINGRHHRTEFDTWMVTSSTQGWLFEVDDDGKIVSSFVNTYDAKRSRALHLSEAWRLPTDYFDKEFWKSCAEDLKLL